MHADFCIWYGSALNINVNFIKLFDCINCIKMFGGGWTGFAQTHAESTRGKEKRRIHGGREVATGLDPPNPQDLGQIAATAVNQSLHWPDVSL